ncbi:MAG: methionine adenosyltransferase [Alphaproteobacteria bacterium]
MPNQKSYLFTSEAVSPGHPDKVADQISDAILDAFLAKDPHARVACETLVTADYVFLAGEMRSTHAAEVMADIEKVVRKTIARIGYEHGLERHFDAATVKIQNHLHAQAAEIAQGVDAGDRDSDGAGDQGIMFGYACDETPELMPAPLHYAHELLRRLQKRRLVDKRLRPDAKSQLTFVYENGRPVRVHTLLVSHQHAPELTQALFTDIVVEEAKAMLGNLFTAETRVLVNPTGSFVNGGPATDTGLTGRKIIVDSYGGSAHHGGGAFSGKDPTKVDRSAAYIARYLAKNIVAAKLATKCEIQLCYAIGVPEPLAIYVDTHGTAAQGVTEDAISAAIYKTVDLRPRGLRERLGLAAPIYEASAQACHFGHAPDSMGKGTFGWERTDIAEQLKKAVLG